MSDTTSQPSIPDPLGPPGLAPSASAQERPDPEAQTLFDVGDDTGITEEDQQEIYREIEQAVQENRIPATPDVLLAHPRKSGVLMPVLTNVLALLFIAAAIFGFIVYFGRREAQASTSAGSLASAEGQLIEQVRKESREQLQAKDQEIGKIQSQLADISRERELLQGSMEQAVRDKETALRAEMQAQLDQERENLSRQGASEEEIAKRLQELEDRQQREYDAELDQIASQAQEEMAEKERALAAAQQQFQDRLDQSRNERLALEQESHTREAELRSQYETKQQELQQQTSEAQTQLQELRTQQEQQSLILDTLLGNYQAVKSSIQRLEYASALDDLESMREILVSQQFTSIPALLKRRPVELFLIDTLQAMITREQEQAAVDTTDILAAADLLTKMEQLVQAADTAGSEGDTPLALESYTRALDTIPTIQHAYTSLQSIQRSQTANRVAELQRQASQQTAAGNYDTAAAAYEKALKLLPNDRETLEDILASILRTGYLAQSDADQVRDTRQSGDAMDSAASLAAQGSHLQAIDGFVAMIRSYPASDLVPAAMDGIKSAVDAEILQRDTANRRQLDELATEYEARLAEAEQDGSDAIQSLITDHQDELRSLRELQEKEITELAAGHDRKLLDAAAEQERALLQATTEYEQQMESFTAATEARIAEIQEQAREQTDADAAEQAQAQAAASTEKLEAELERKNLDIQELNAEVADLTKELSTKTQEIPDSVQARLAAANSIKNQVDELQAAYLTRKAEIRQIVEQENADRYSEALSGLHGFLADDRIETLFPALHDLLTALEENVVSATSAEAAAKAAALARNSALESVLTAMTYLSGTVDDPRVRQTLAEEVEGDVAFATIVQEIQGLVAAMDGATATDRESITSGKTQLLGTVSFIALNSVTIEPLLELPVAAGTRIQIRTRSGLRDVLVAEGTIDSVTGDRITASIDRLVADSRPVGVNDMVYAWAAE